MLRSAGFAIVDQSEIFIRPRAAIESGASSYYRHSYMGLLREDGHQTRSEAFLRLGAGLPVSASGFISRITGWTNGPASVCRILSDADSSVRVTMGGGEGVLLS